MSNLDAVLPSSPFFLHPDENPTLALVQPLLTEHNYHTWSRSMKMSLISKNKLGFVDGTIKAPSASDTMFSCWQRCNAMVVSWLLNSLSPSIAESVSELDIAESIWSVLYARFAQRDSLRLSDLMEEFHSLKQGSQSVKEYYTLMKVVWDEILNLRPVPSCPCQPKCTCVALGSIEECFNADQVIQFVKGLNDNFASLKTQILLMKPLPPITTAFSMAITVERQLVCTENRPHSGTIPSPANLSFSSSVDYDTGGNGVSVPQQPCNALNIGRGKSWVQGPKKIKCTFCGLNGHTIEKCYKKHGYPPGWHRPRAHLSQTIASNGDQAMSYAMSQSDNVESSSSAPITQGQFQQLLQMLRANSIGSSSSEAKGAAETYKTMEHMLNPTAALQADLGKEKDDYDHLQMAGVKDNSNVLLGEDTRDKALGSGEINETDEISRGCKAVAEIRTEVDKLAEKVSAVQAVVNGGMKTDEKGIIYLTEMLMRELIKLDTIDAAGEGRIQRKKEARRIQSFIEEMDQLKARNQ